MSQRPSNIVGFRTLEHNQAKLSKFSGLHLQRSVDNVSSSYLFRLFVFGFAAMELLRYAPRGLWGSVSLSGKFGRLGRLVEKSFYASRLQSVEKDFHARAQVAGISVRAQPKSAEVGWSKKVLRESTALSG